LKLMLEGDAKMWKKLEVDNTDRTFVSVGRQNLKVEPGKNSVDTTRDITVADGIMVWSWHCFYHSEYTHLASRRYLLHVIEHLQLTS
jgi:hypothetical protein